jgi:hypothetical protein
MKTIKRMKAGITLSELAPSLGDCGQAPDHVRDKW